MNTALLFLGLFYGVYGEDKIHWKQSGTAGEPKAELMIQRLTLPVNYVGGLYWNEKEQMLGYPDVESATYHMWYRDTGVTDKAYLQAFMDKKFMFGLPIKHQYGSYLVAVNREFRIVTNTSDGYKVSAPVLKLNDTSLMITSGHSDSKGRLFFGTKSLYHLKAKLYKVENGKAQVMKEIPSSIEDLAWSVDFKKLYIITDSGQCIWQYSYNLDKGTIDNQEKVFNVMEHRKLGTRMTGIETDDNGTLWVTSAPSGVLMNIDPETKDLLQVVKLPVCLPTCITFGGYKNRNLYVGSKRNNIEYSAGEGSVFVVSGFSIYGTPDQEVAWPK